MPTQKKAKINPMLKFDKFEFGKRLLELRKSKGLSQEDFGKSISASRGQINNMEKGKVNCGIDFIIKIAATYHVNLNYLLVGDGDMYITGYATAPPGRENIIAAFETFGEIVWLSERSPMFRHLLISQATRLLYENTDSVLKDIDNYNNARKKKAPKD